MQQQASQQSHMALHSKHSGQIHEQGLDPRLGMTTQIKKQARQETIQLKLQTHADPHSEKDQHLVSTQIQTRQTPSLKTQGGQ
jgi:hypothetical protein